MIQPKAVLPLADLSDKVLDFTAEIFGNPATIEIDSDPDIPGSEHFLLRVVANGEVADVLRLDHEWHQRLLATAGDNAIHFRLLYEMT